MPSMLPFTEEDFAPAWEQSKLLLPSLRQSKIDAGFNGIFSFTPDGGPLVGESAEVKGFWIAEAVWVTHSAGVARAVAQLLVDGRSEFELHGCDVAPFRGRPARRRLRQRNLPAELRRDLRHPAPAAAQGRRRATCGSARSTPGRRSSVPCSWRAAAGSGRTGTRPTPRWSPTCRPHGRRRSAMPGRRGSHSPIAAAEAWNTRTAVAMYDMTPLKRLEVSGPGALDLLRAADHRPDGQDRRRRHLRAAARPGRRDPQRRHRRPAGDQTCSRSARTAPLDHDYLRRQRPRTAASQVRDITGGTCCIGVCGARSPATSSSRSAATTSRNEGLKYFRAQEGSSAGVPVTAMRLSVRRRARLGALHQRGPRPAAVGRAVGGRAAARRRRRRARRLQQPAAGEGLPVVGHRHDHRIQPVRGRSGLRRAPGQGRLRRPRRTRRVERRLRRRGGWLPDRRRRRSVVLGHEPVFVDGQPGGLRHQRRVRAHHRPADRLRVAAGAASPPGRASRSSTSGAGSRRRSPPNRWSTRR